MEIALDVDRNSDKDSNASSLPYPLRKNTLLDISCAKVFCCKIIEFTDE